MSKFFASLVFVLSAVGASANLAVTLTVYNESCGNGNGSVVAQVSGGAPPYTYAWSNSGMDFFIDNLTAGTYSVTVTDNLGEQANANTTVLNLGYIDIPSPFAGISEAGLHACVGLCNGGFRFGEEFVPNAEPPFTFNATPVVESPGHYAFMGYCGGEVVDIQITDNGGCTGSFYTWPLTGTAATPLQVISVNGACNGQADGSVLVDIGVDPMLGSPLSAYIYTSLGVYTGQWLQGTGLNTFSGLAAGDYYVRREVMAGINGCQEDLPFTIPDLGSTCGTVSGDNWYDVDLDCVFDGAEVGIPYHVLEIQPGPEYAITNGGGQFSRNLANGSYTLAQTDPSFILICPATQPVPFTVNNNTAWIYLADGSTAPLDLATDASQGNARPGFSFPVWAQVSNLSPQLSGAVTVTCTFDPQLVFNNAVPAPTNIAGNLIVWDLPAFGSFAQQNFIVHLDVPVGIALGTILNSQFDVSNTFGDIDATNNVESFSTTVIGSYDPNEKTARTSTGLSDALYYIDQDEYIDYTIRFQNTGTASAIDVVVTDTLAVDLDMGSFQQGVASHAFDVIFKPDGVVEWRFASIHLPAISTNEAMSHGSVSFRIRPHLPLPVGTLLSNTANIFFDLNPPVITAPSVLTAELSTSIGHPSTGPVRQLEVMPNPAHDRIILVTSGAGLLTWIEVLGMDGRSVLSASTNGSRVELAIDVLTPGAYVLRAVIASNEVLHHRFIKQ